MAEIFKGFWPRAGETLSFEDGVTIVIAISEPGVHYTTAEGNRYTEWPPVPNSKHGRATGLLRPHCETYEINVEVEQKKVQIERQARTERAENARKRDPRSPG